MKLFIWKYKDTPQKNYFEGCTFIDKIQINNVLEFPSFNIEFNSETDFTELKTDNFSIRLSRLQTETSANGDTIENFLFPEDKDNKFLCMFQVSETNNLANIAGFIQIDSIKIDCNTSGWYIEYNVIGILREFAEFYETKNIAMLTPTVSPQTTFNSYIQNLHFTNQRNWYLANQLGMTTKAGAEVKISTPLQSNIIYRQDISQWQGFKDIALETGFSYRLICSNIDPYAFNEISFNLILFWRSDALQTITPQILEHEKSISLKYNNKWVYQANRHHIYTVGGNSETRINGWLMNEDTLYNFDTYAEGTGNPGYPVFIAAGTSERFGNQGNDIRIVGTGADTVIVNWVDIFAFSESLYSVTGLYGKFKAGSITYARVLVFDFTYNLTTGNYNDSGVQQIMANTAIPEYRFLLRGIKETKRIKVIYDTDLGLFSKFSDGVKDYLIERISHIDIYKQTAVIDCIEI